MSVFRRRLIVAVDLSTAATARGDASSDDGDGGSTGSSGTNGQGWVPSPTDLDLARRDETTIGPSDLQRADFHPPPWLVPLLRHSIVEGVSLPIPASVVAARQRLFRDAEERGQ